MNTVTDNKPMLPSLVSGGAIRPIIPQDFDQAWRIGNAIAKAGMQPPGLETPEKITIAILAGMEIGLPPMQAIQSIAIINNRPTVYGDGALALVRASGLLEEMNERTDGQGDAMIATCKVRRRGEPQATVRQFSVVDAKKAGLWTRKGPWEHYPARMLAMRARAFALRDAFADVLRGLGIAEEQADIDRPALPRPPAPPAYIPGGEVADDLDPFPGAPIFQDNSGGVHSPSAAAEQGGGEGLQQASATADPFDASPAMAPHTSGVGSDEPSATPRPSSLPPAERRVLIESAMQLATRPGFETDERLSMLDELRAEAGKLSGLSADTIKDVVSTAAKVVRKELTPKAATKYLESAP